LIFTKAFICFKKQVFNFVNSGAGRQAGLSTHEHWVETRRHPLLANRRRHFWKLTPVVLSNYHDHTKIKINEWMKKIVRSYLSIINFLFLVICPCVLLILLDSDRHKVEICCPNRGQELVSFSQVPLFQQLKNLTHFWSLWSPLWLYQVRLIPLLKFLNFFCVMYFTNPPSSSSPNHCQLIVKRVAYI
jgi:hypothetical protein